MTVLTVTKQNLKRNLTFIQITMVKQDLTNNIQATHSANCIKLIKTNFTHIFHYLDLTFSLPTREKCSLGPPSLLPS